MLDNIDISGDTLIWSLAGIFVLVIALIFIGRFMVRGKKTENLTSKYQNHKWSSPLEARAKYPDVDVFRLSLPFLLLGAVLALGITWLSFNYTQDDASIYIPDNALDLPDDIEVEPPRTSEPPPPPPPPPPPVIEEVPEELIEEDDEIEFVDQSVEEETVVVAPVVEEKAPPPPPPPPPPAPKEEEIFRVVEQMPRFPGCEDISGTREEKKACADKKMLEFLYGNIKYPAIARENGIEGNVVVSFVVEKDGAITDPKVIRDPGAGLGDESVRVVDMMSKLPQKWTPGQQRGNAVRVQFILPVKFELKN